VSCNLSVDICHGFLTIAILLSLFSLSDDSGGVCDGVEYYPRHFYAFYAYFYVPMHLP